MEREQDTERFLAYMQRYVPHLQQLVEQFRDPKRKNRELQLTKLEGLLDMITDKNKRLKWDTLRKCEDVMRTIFQKVQPNLLDKIKKFDVNKARSAMGAGPMDICTPESPSPPREFVPASQPKVIPTEKIIPTSAHTEDEDQSYDIVKPDIYNVAAESLMRARNKQATTNGLDNLSAGFDYTSLSTERLEDLREKLRQQIISDGAKDDERLPEMKLEVEEPRPSANDNAQKSEQNSAAPKEPERPVFKRLADKYNPRPRKPSTNDPHHPPSGARPISDTFIPPPRINSQPLPSSLVTHSPRPDPFLSAPRVHSLPQMSPTAPNHMRPYRPPTSFVPTTARTYTPNAMPVRGFNPFDQTEGATNNRETMPMMPAHAAPPTLNAYETPISPKREKPIPVTAPILPSDHMKKSVIKDPRIRSREQRNTTATTQSRATAVAPPRVDPRLERRPSIDHKSKYDQLYSSLDRDADTYRSPLDGLFNQGDKQRVAAALSFKIPKKPRVVDKVEQGAPVADTSEPDTKPVVGASNAPVSAQKKRKRNRKRRVRSVLISDSEEGEEQAVLEGGSSEDRSAVIKMENKADEAQKTGECRAVSDTVPIKVEQPVVISDNAKESPDTMMTFGDLERGDRSLRVTPGGVSVVKQTPPVTDTCTSETKLDDVICVNTANVPEKTSVGDTAKDTSCARASTETSEKTKEIATSSNVEALNNMKQGLEKLVKPEQVEPALTLLAKLFTDSQKDLLQGLVDKIASGLDESTHKIKKIRRVLISDSDDDSDAEKQREASKKEAREKEEREAKDKEKKELAAKEKELAEFQEATNVTDDEDESYAPQRKLRTLPGRKLKPNKTTKKATLKVAKVVHKKPMSLRTRQNQTSVKMVKMRTATNVRKTELDRLHEDIREMYIRDAVLAATGKRGSTHRGTNDDDDVDNNEGSSPPMTTRTKLHQTPKVVIEKTDLRQWQQQRQTVLSEEDEDVVLSERLRKTRTNVSSKEDDRRKRGVAEVGEEERKTKRKKVIKDEVEGEVETMKRTRKKKRARWQDGVFKVTKKKKQVDVDDGHLSETSVASSDAASHVSISPTKNGSGNSRPTSATAIVNTPDIALNTTNESKELHDPNYYLNPSNIMECKLCYYEGKTIIQHYRNSHPEIDNLASRLAPDDADLAIRENAQFKLDEILAVDQTERTWKKKFYFHCRICKIDMITTTEAFFDHFTTHTGEPRYWCSQCNFRSSNVKSFRFHHSASHGQHTIAIKPTFPSPPNFRLAFGFMCTVCHFIQLQVAVVDRHVTNCHDGTGRVCKVSLSSPLFEAEEEEEEEEVKQRADSVLPETTQVAPPPSAKPTNVKVKRRRRVGAGNDSAASSASGEKAEETSGRLKVEVMDVDEERAILARQEEEDRATLARQEDEKRVLEQLEEEKRALEKLEEEKRALEKLEEEKRAAQAQLEEEQRVAELAKQPKEETPEEAELRKAKEKEKELAFVCDDDFASEDLRQQQEKEDKMREVTKQLAQKKPTYNLLDRLKDRLSNLLSNVDDEAEVAATPPVLEPAVVEPAAPALPTPTEAVFIKEEPHDELTASPPMPALINITQLNPLPEREIEYKRVGPVEVKIIDNTQKIYSCYMASCTYSTSSFVQFEVHCRDAHQLKHWNGWCEMCEMFVDDERRLSIDKAFLHLMDIHVRDPRPPPEAPKPTVYLRTRRLSGDMLSCDQMGEKETDAEKDKTIPFVLNESAENAFPFKITEVTTLTPEQEMALETAGGADQPQEQQQQQQPNEAHESGGVNVYADGLDPNSQPLDADDGKQEKPKKARRILLRDIPMEPMQIYRTRKSAAAMEHYLKPENLVNLYKCPEYTCFYSCDSRKLFDAHIQQHNNLQAKKFIPCLYCNFQTELSQVTVHIDVRHSRARFYCLYCLYRASCQSFVEFHQRLKHWGKPLGVLMKLPINYEVYSTRAHMTLPPLPATMSEDVEADLSAYEHKEEMKCSRCTFTTSNTLKVMRHMRVQHYIVSFCRYCMFGAKTNRELYSHFALMHPSHPPHIVSMPWNQQNEKQTEPLVHLTQEIPTFITPRALTIYRKEAPPAVPAPPAPPPADELVLIKVPIKDVPSSVKMKSKVLVDKSKKLQIGEQPVVVVGAATATATGESSVPAPTPVLFNLHLVPESDSETVRELQEKEADCGEDPLRIDDVQPSTSGGGAGEPEETLDSMALQEISGEDASISVEDLKDITKKRGLSKDALYICGLCAEPYKSSQLLRMHLHNHCAHVHKQTFKPYKCAHCSKHFKSVVTLLDHMRLHGTERFRCSMCEFRHQHPIYVRSHLKLKHKVMNVQVVPLNPSRKNMDADEYVIRPKVRARADEEREQSAPSTEPTPPTKTSFSPTEIDLIPMNHIFSQVLKCSLCTYQCKVRRNLIRHLQFHLSVTNVPESDPVNPVPCLEKNEKMFDKMTNLAASSFTDSGRMSGKAGATSSGNYVTAEQQQSLPQFVPATKRYVCGATNCNYLCLEEVMLRSHLLTLHADDTYYTCKHCNDEQRPAHGPIDIDRAVKHLRLHDFRLYLCAHCPFKHNMRHKVERHVRHDHPTLPAHVKIVREINEHAYEEQQQQQQQQAKLSSDLARLDEDGGRAVKKWRCGMCRFRCAEEADARAHVQNKHDIDYRYKCALCMYRNDDREAFADHFLRAHPSNTVDLIETYCRVEGAKGAGTPVETPVFDSTPLWQRNRAVKYIRGIPVEEAQAQAPKTTKRSPMQQQEEKRRSGAEEAFQKACRRLSLADERGVARGGKRKTHLDDCIEAVASGSTTRVSSPYSILKSSLTGATRIVKAETDVDVNVEDGEVEEAEVEAETTTATPTTTPTPAPTPTSSDAKSQELWKYGVGLPVGNNFCCPICNSFKTTKITHFTGHLYQELRICRYKCMECSRPGYLYDVMKKHVVKCHPTKSNAIIDETEIETGTKEWINKVVQGQTEIIRKAEVLAKCSYCEYTCRFLADMRKHERRHWVQKPLRCGYCTFEGVTNYEITLHSRRAHPDLDINIVTLPVPPNPQIRPVKIGVRRRPLPDSSSTSTAAPTTPPPTPPAKPTKSVALPTKLMTLRCDVCGIDGEEDFLRDHLEVVHAHAKAHLCYQCETCHRLYKTRAAFNDHWDACVTRSKSVAHFDCTYCECEFDERHLLIAHHNTLHSHLELVVLPELRPQENAPRKVKCTECAQEFVDYRLMLEHFRQHRRPYLCGYCDSAYNFPGRLKLHLNRDHAGLPVRTNVDSDCLDQLQLLQKHMAALDEQGARKRRRVEEVSPSKGTARKSTASAGTTCGYSFYGSRADVADLTETTVRMFYNGSIVTARPMQFRQLFDMDIFPTVEVVDYVKYPK